MPPAYGIYGILCVNPGPIRESSCVGVCILKLENTSAQVLWSQVLGRWSAHVSLGLRLPFWSSHGSVGRWSTRSCPAEAMLPGWPAFPLFSGSQCLALLCLHRTLLVFRLSNTTWVLGHLRCPRIFS